MILDQDNCCWVGRVLLRNVTKILKEAVADNSNNNGVETCSSHMIRRKSTSLNRTDCVGLKGNITVMYMTNKLDDPLPSTPILYCFYNPYIIGVGFVVVVNSI